MHLIRGYIATTLDGFIADPEGRVGFLDPYGAEEAGYADFIAKIGTIVMGRLTYEAVREMGAWPYEGKRCLVVSSRALGPLPADTTAWTNGVDALIGHLRALEEETDAWVLGGGRLQQAFLDRDALDRLELFVVPVILGRGLPLFPGTDVRQTLRLVDAGRVGEIARLVYERG
jgi:dihydrofolate reductase